MTKERAIHKIEFSIKAYQNLINQNVSEGEAIVDGVQGKWQSDKAPIKSYQEMIDALTMAKEALQEKPHCIAAVTLNEEKMRELCHKAAQELFERIDEALKNRETARKVLYFGDGFANGHIVYDMAECPACGKTFEEDYSGWLDPYCSHCGQKLDWGFEEIEEEGSNE